MKKDMENDKKDVKPLKSFYILNNLRRRMK